MEEFIIYEDEQFKLSQELAKGGRPFWDYPLCIKGEEKTQHIFSGKDIKDIGKTPRGKLEAVLDNIDLKIRESLEKANLSVDSAHLAICLAYIDMLTTPRDSDLPSCAYGPIVE